MDAGAIDRLWWNGELRAAYLLSRDQLQMPSGDPFRGGSGTLDDAARWHAHGARAWHLARFDEAGRMLDAAYQVRQSALGDGHAHTLATLERLAALADYTDQRDLAARRYQQAIEGWIGLEGTKSLGAAIARRNYASYLRTRGGRDEAHVLLDQAEKVFKKRVADDDPEYLALRKSRALLLCFAGDAMAAARTAEHAIERTKLSHDHPFVAAAYLTLARALEKLGEIDSARNLVRDVIASFERGYGDHPLVAIAYSVLAEILVDLGDLAAATDATRRWYAMYRMFYTPETFVWGVSACARFVAVEQLADAIELADEMVRLVPAKGHACYVHIANYYLRRGQHTEGLDWLDRASNIAPAADRANYVEIAASWRRNLARAKVPT